MEDHIKKYSTLGKNNSHFVDEARVGLMEGYHDNINKPIGYQNNIAQVNQPYGQNYYTQGQTQREDLTTTKSNLWVYFTLTVAIYVILAYILIVYK